MNLKTQLFVFLVVILCLIRLTNLVRHSKVTLQYSLLWYLLGITILLLICFPKLITSISNFLGIGLPINFLFFSGFCFALIIIFFLSSEVSKLSESNKILNQELALLKKKIEELYIIDSEEIKK